jgi:hypothetical protein
LPFLPLFDGVLGGTSFRMLNSSRVTRSGNLTFHVMGGKSGKKRQHSGKVDGKNGMV